MTTDTAQTLPVQSVMVTAAKPADSDVLLVVDEDRELGGWLEVRVTRGVERLPSDFQVTLTEKFPGTVEALQIRPGDPVVLLIGSDRVITGFVDVVRSLITPEGHSVTILGRSACQDLVDCSAEWPGGQIQGNSVLDIARKLAAPYGLEVTALTAPGDPIPLYQLNIGETAFEIIEKLCRYRQLLAYDDTDGNLLLSAVGTVAAASGFQEGVNVERAEVALSAHQRYSRYESYSMSLQSLNDLGDVDYTNSPPVIDDGVKRHRVRKVFCPTSGPLGTAFAEDRLVWEAVRRAGRSYAVSLTTDTWRDAAGALYAPNTLVRLQLPTLHLPDVTWLVSEVTFRRDAEGTHCDLLIMPQQSFIPEPQIIFQIPAELLNQQPSP